MSRFYLFLAALLCLSVPAANGAESVEVDSQTRQVINAGEISFAAGHLTIDHIPVISGSGGGGTLLSSLTLNVPPVLFTNPVTFNVGSSDVLGTLNFADSPAGSIFGNSTGLSGPPSYITDTATKKGLVGLSNVENTALSTWPGSINITTIGNITAGSVPFTLVSGVLSAGQIPNSIITYGKIQDVLGNGLLGNPSATTGPPTRIPLGAGLAFQSGALVSTVTSSVGTVTNFTAGTLSPLFTTAVATSTTTPALSFSLSNAAPFTFLGNNTNGTALPTFGLIDSLQSGTNNTNDTWLSGKTLYIESNPISGSDKTLLLPPTSGYADGKIISYVDTKTTANFGRLISPSGTDTLNGNNASFWTPGYRPFIGAGLAGHSKIMQFSKQGTNWQALLDTLSAIQVCDPTDASSCMNLDATALTTSHSTFIPDSDTTWPIPFTPVPGFWVTGLVNGALQTSPIYEKDVRANVDDVTETSGTHTVPNTGAIDVIRVVNTLTGPLNIVLPSLANYTDGRTIFFYDTSGSITATNTAALVGQPGETVNGNSSLVFTKARESRYVTGNNSTLDWIVPIYSSTTSGGGISLDTWHTATPVSGTATLNCSSAVDMNLHIVPMSAAVTLAMSGVANGQKGRVRFNDSTGNHVVTLPSGWKSPDTSPKGTFLTTTGTNVEDEWSWDYNDTDGGIFTKMGANLTALVTTYNTVADSGPSNIGTTDGLLGKSSAYKYDAFQVLAGSSYACGHIAVNLRTFGTPANLVGNIGMEVHPDAIMFTDTGASTTNGSNVVQMSATVTLNSFEIGQYVVGTNIPIPSYISAFDNVAKTITLVTTKGGSTASNATASAASTVDVYGSISSTVLATFTSVPVTSIPAAYSTTYTDFTGAVFNTDSTPTSTHSPLYWVVLFASNPLNNSTDYVAFRMSGTTGWMQRNGSIDPPNLAGLGAGLKANFITYKP